MLLFVVVVAIVVVVVVVVVVVLAACGFSYMFCIYNLFFLFHLYVITCFTNTNRCYVILRSVSPALLFIKIVIRCLFFFFFLCFIYEGGILLLNQCVDSPSFL